MGSLRPGRPVSPVPCRDRGNNIRVTANTSGSVVHSVGTTAPSSGSVRNKGSFAMFNDPSTPVVRKPMGFLAVTALGLSSVLVTAIVCVSGVAVYGIRLLDKKSTNLVDLVQQAAQSLPEIRAALPPVLADAIDDVRAPEYRDELRICTGIGETTDRWGYRRATVSVENTGDKTVSMLSLRLVGLDGDGNAATESAVWAATPLQLDDEWRGPLLPRETRRMVIRTFCGKEVKSIEPEISEIRTWVPETAPVKPAEALSSRS